MTCFEAARCRYRPFVAGAIDNAAPSRYRAGRSALPLRRVRSEPSPLRPISRPRSRARLRTSCRKCSWRSFTMCGSDRPRDNLKGWLFKVAHNLALKHRQKIKRRETDFAHDIELADLVIDPALNPEQRLAEEQRQVRLRAVHAGAARARPSVPLAAGRRPSLSRDRRSARDLTRLGRQVRHPFPCEVGKCLSTPPTKICSA